MTAAQFTGETDQLIASGTNPWLHNAMGQPIDLEKLRRPQKNHTCDSCEDSPVVGAIIAMDTPDGIQRCDACEVFDGDLTAALAVAKYIGPLTTVWFDTETKGGSDA